MTYVKKSVMVLPTLQEGLATLPELPDGATLLVFGTDMRNGEKEMVLGFLATAAVRNNAWKPISVVEFWTIMKECTVPFIRHQDVFNAAWELADAGLLDIVRLEPEEMDYVIPTAALTKMLDAAQLRFAAAKPKAPQTTEA